MSDHASDSAPQTSARPNVFAGHLGHLTKEQEDALTKFKEILASSNLYTPASAASPASHDDPTLLYVYLFTQCQAALIHSRFLRARTFQPLLALRQFAAAEAWRRAHGVDRLYATFDPDEFEYSKRFYPRWTGRRDKNGLPLYVYRIQSVAPIHHEIEAVPPERRFERIIALYELMVRFSFPLCSHLSHPSSPTPISSTTTIIDLDSVSLASLWKLRSHLQEASRLAGQNYPETLYSIAIVNSPSFFPIIWGWIKAWFDETTRNKILVLGKDMGIKLREIIHAKDLPKVYGGELDWSYGDAPSLDEDGQQALGEIPKGPLVFVDGAPAKPLIPSDTHNG